MRAPMNEPDAAPLSRSERTLVASWQAFARGAHGAAVHRLPAAVAAVFPQRPESAFFNNALLAHGLGAAGAAAAIETLARTYADAGVDRFAAWALEADAPARTALERRGYVIDTATTAMALRLEQREAGPLDPHVAPAGWAEYRAFLSAFDLPADLMAGVDGDAFHVVVASDAGELLAAGLAFDCDGDCGIFNIATLPHARRRGLGTAVTAALLRDARERGCETASLQSTEAAAGIYRSVGFRTLGRYVEYVPPLRGEDR